MSRDDIKFTKNQSFFDAANKRLLDQLKADKEIYDAIRESELVEEMENKVEAYRKRMNKD